MIFIVDLIIDNIYTIFELSNNYFIPLIHMSFSTILNKYRNVSFSERDKGDRFERIIKAYLLTDPKYTTLFEKVYLWNEFPFRNELGGNDTGIDIVGVTYDNKYWAIQCKCYAENTLIDKKAVDTFLSTSSRAFNDDKGELIHFDQCLWISTSNNWTSTATESLKNQRPPVSRINIFDLESAPVDWEKLENNITGSLARNKQKELRQHQIQAKELTHNHFKENDRGKLIMACGTGKTFTSLRIAENETNHKGLVLFLVPSIALLGQTLNEWSGDAINPINAICICSDAEITKKKSKAQDIDTSSIIDLALPASTNVPNIIRQFERLKHTSNDGMTVVFSTYQSIEVISKAQKELSEIHPEFAEFDLIICDEAHRTTGAKLVGEDESAFTKVHDNDFIKSKKRLYMTATPRLYDTDTKSRAAQAEATLWSMDDESIYGKEIYRIGFGEAVEKKLLTDYKVLILTLNENDVPPVIQQMITNGESEIKVDDMPKLIGCINALSKQVLGDEGLIKATDPSPMKRAVAFCSSIANSETITQTFNAITHQYIDELPEKAKEHTVTVQSKHIDGSMTATEREQLMSWIKEDTAEGECKILTNVRCLSEGVDVPSLDAVMFLSARNSQVDVVQSVGRVMRLSEGKQYGYIIIPVVVPSNISAEEALNDNERFKVVWTVLNALRAHDDRFNATVNKIELNKKKPSNILVGGSAYEFDENGNPIERGNYEGGSAEVLANQLKIQFEELQSAVFARMVQKVGDRRYWEQWAKSVADIAQRQIDHIQNLIANSPRHQAEFEKFLSGLRNNLNPSIQEVDAIEMLSQHLITKPVFEALFEGYSFAQSNAMSQSMQRMIDLLQEEQVDDENDTLEKFYESVKMRASGIDNAEGKQKIIIELYDKFFKTAFPKMVEKLGIVYTPTEVVDFVIHSVDDVLKKEFGRGLTEENVHILDPFTGTGTFITRLLQSGVIKPEDLDRKYQNEIHANELVLLAYYIASVNIENVYHELTPDPNDGIGKEVYLPFNGICLTDTFQLGETKEGEIKFSEMFPKNSERVEKQIKTPIKVIIGNPPYSVGQKSANDNAQNQSYPILDKKIANTYAKLTDATNKNSLYDSYIKAFRWSSDRIDENEGGIVAFVTNGAWLDGNSTDGFRKSLEKEFDSIYVFNLRGNARTSGELRQKEGGGVFGLGSRTPISITLLVKNPQSKKEKASIFYKDIGDYLSREDKLKIVKETKTFLNPSLELTQLKPNEHGDWINQRNDAFDNFIELGDKKGDNIEKSFFVPFYSNGLKTQRDSWCYNSNNSLLLNNVRNTIDFYNTEATDLKSKLEVNKSLDSKQILNFDDKKISWTRALIWDAEKGKQIQFKKESIRIASYRPFFKQFLYFDRSLNEMVYQIPKLFPKKEFENLVICVPGAGDSKEFSLLIAKNIPDLGFNGACQCFPLYYYEEPKTVQKGLFDDSNQSDYVRRDAISDFIYERAKKQYGKNVTKEDIFYYVYGFLHSKEYRETFEADLKKMLPKLPLVEDVRDFWAFSKAGTALADLHLNYESVSPHPDVIVNGDSANYFKVDKMRFPKKGQKDTIIFNNHITITNIPEKAYEYVVNGKSAIEWIMERYQITTHKDSGITNNPNDWADEVGNPRYILDLLLSIINVSTQTVDIVNELPKLKFD